MTDSIRETGQSIILRRGYQWALIAHELSEISKQQSAINYQLLACLTLSGIKLTLITDYRQLSTDRAIG
jgi:hypothetical protein